MTLNEQYNAATTVKDFLALVWDGPKIDPEFKERWLAALRSGDYKQTNGALYRVKVFKTVPPKPVGFCCLGVACDISGAGWQEIPDFDPLFYSGAYTFDPRAGDGTSSGETSYFQFFPREAREAVYGEHDTLRPPLGNILAGQNDAGCTFKQIANWIEKNL